jgi:ABC-type antimicrobial peptide transport system permease subunit
MGAVMTPPLLRALRALAPFLLLAPLPLAAQQAVAPATTTALPAPRYAQPNDPWIAASTVALIAIVSAAAGLIPAHRASRIDPILALRYE